METENRLIIALKLSNEFAFKSIYDTYADKTYRCAFLLLKDKEWSEDIVQEVFIRLWNYRQNLDAKGNLWSFLYVLTKRLCFNRLKEVKRDRSSFDKILRNSIVVADCSHDILVAKELANHLENILNTLPERQRKVFELSRFEGLSHQEIAQKLQISPHTVKNHMTLALKVVRKHAVQANCIALLTIIEVLLILRKHT